MANLSAPQTPAHISEKKPAQAPWNAALGVIFVVIIFYVVQILAFLIVSIYPQLHHWSSSHTTYWFNHSVVGQFFFILVAETLIIGAVISFVRAHRMKLALIGLRKPVWSDIAYGLLAVPVYLLLYGITVAIASALIPGLDVNQSQDIGFNDVHGSLQMVLTFISLAVLPPLAEEILVRGFLYTTLKKVLPTVGAVLLTSAIFASAHLPEGGAAGPLYIAAIDTFILSLVLIYLREKTNGLWSGILLHAVKNSIAFVMLFVIHVR